MAIFFKDQSCCRKSSGIFLLLLSAVTAAALCLVCVSPAYADVTEITCDYRLGIDNTGGHRSDQARIGYSAGTGKYYRVWAEFTISELAGKKVLSVGFRVHNDWAGDKITSLRYTPVQPSVEESAMTAQHIFSNKYIGFTWSIKPGDAWTPNTNNFFRPDWSGWPRQNGNTLIRDIQAHIDSGKNWFAVEFDCLQCTTMANLRMPEPNEATAGSIIMEVRTEDAPSDLVAEKNFGLCTSCADCPSAGNPINFATGNKYEAETDFSLHGPGLPMRFTRYYNSQSEIDGIAGYGWTTSFSEHTAPENGMIILYEADGTAVYFKDTGDGIVFISETGAARTLRVIGSGYRLTEPDGKILNFNGSGALIRISDRMGNSQTITYSGGKINTVQDNFGRIFGFSYNTDGHLKSLATPGGSFSYTYSNNNMIRVTKPDAAFRRYEYNDSADSHNLTGIVNENGSEYVTFIYDDRDRAVRSAGIGGKNAVDILYDGSTRTVTDSKNNSVSFTMDAKHGIGRVKSSSGSGCASCPASSGRDFTSDDRFRILTAKDAKGNITRYTYDDRGNILSLTEAAGSSEERITMFTWHTDYNLPLSIIRPGAVNGTVTDRFEYDGSGNLIRVKENSGTALERVTKN